MRDNRCTIEASVARDERGVSEVLAFVLVFGIILTSVAILSVTGFQAMDSYQENEQQRNADRAMQTLADNFNDVLRYDGLEERYGELTVRGGTVTIDGDGGPVLDVTVDGQPIVGEDEFEHLDNGGGELSLGSFAYESGGERISYEGSAVVRTSDAGGITLMEPQLTHTDQNGEDIALVSLVVIDGDRRSLQTDGSQGVTIAVENRTSKLYTDDDTDIEITVAETDSDENDVWADDILADGGWDDTEADRVLVTVVEAEIDY